MYKVIILTLVAGLGALCTLNAQQFKKAFSASGEKKIIFRVENATLVIEGYSGNEVVIDSDDSYEIPERAKGLRPLYNGATDNTGLGLEVTESNNVMTVKKASSQDGEYRFRVPADAGIQIEEIGWMSDEYRLTSLRGEVEVSSNGSDITLENVTGPVVANSTSGDITVVFSELNQQQPTSISAVSGFIDITMPTASKASFDLNSITGEIYTDLDIKMPNAKEGMNMIGGRKINGTLNGGGVEISLRAISGDIYLRKK